MLSLISRGRMLLDYARERLAQGAEPLVGDPSRGVIILLDGIGGIQIGPLVARRGFREAGLPHATYLFDWHRGFPGELLGDLIALRRNLVSGARLARLIRSFRRAYPTAPLHVLAYSGGTGVAIFAAERLGRRARIDTLILACPALSPTYPLTPALRNVHRCIGLISRRDFGLLGLGTCLFGSIDRRFGLAAGLVGFHRPRILYPDDELQYRKLEQVHWCRDFCRLGHFGHHMGWASTAFIREQIAPWLDPTRATVISDSVPAQMGLVP
ncbi:MAG TPA: hypothetical protein VGM03_11865 [Phycisphaerae bacterium]|jgi:pimeloyl-ACP methyl ester carboxylesterase